MEISSDIAGIRSREREVELTWRQTMNYAAGRRATSDGYMILMDSVGNSLG